MLHLFNFLHRVFARGGERSTSAFYVHILDICKKAYLGGSGCGQEWQWSRKREAELEVQSSRCSGSVGQGHAARAHMESRLNSSADSNCPSVVSLEQHVSRQRRLAARTRYPSSSWFAPSKREARCRPAVRARVTVSTGADISRSQAQMASDIELLGRAQRQSAKKEDAFTAFSDYSKTEVLYFSTIRPHVSVSTS